MEIANYIDPDQVEHCFVFQQEEDNSAHILRNTRKGLSWSDQEKRNKSSQDLSLRDKSQKQQRAHAFKGVSGQVQNGSKLPEEEEDQENVIDDGEINPHKEFMAGAEDTHNERSKSEEKEQEGDWARENEDAGGAKEELLENGDDLEKQDDFQSEIVHEEGLEEVVEQLKEQQTPQTRVLPPDLGVPVMLAEVIERVDRAGDASIDPSPSLTHELKRSLRDVSEAADSRQVFD